MRPVMQATVRFFSAFFTVLKKGFETSFVNALALQLGPSSTYVQTSRRFQRIILIL
jgi:hypothetical protein